VPVDENYAIYFQQVPASNHQKIDSFP